MDSLGYILISVGWFSFLVFLFLPVFEAQGFFGLGARFFSSGFFSVIVFSLGLFGNIKEKFLAIFCITFNLSIILSPLLINSNFVWLGKIYFILASILTVVVTIILTSKESSSGDINLGFYLWSLSFILIAIGFNLL